MNKTLRKIVDKLISENKDYNNFKLLIDEIEKSGESFNRREILGVFDNKKELGFYYTPDVFCKLISEIAKEKKYSSAIDICCGTGNLLYHLKDQIPDLTGIEINENISTLARYINQEAKIINADSLNYSFERKYDLVVGELPWGMTNHNGKRRELSEIFIRKAFQICNEGGNIIVTAPPHILNIMAFKDFRQEFSKHTSLIVTFPAANNKAIEKFVLLKFSMKKSEAVRLGNIDDLQDFNKNYADFITKNILPEEFGDRWDLKYYEMLEKPLYKKLAEVETKTLGEIAEIIKGRQIEKSAITSNKGDYIYLDPRNLTENGIIYSDPQRYVDKESLKESDFRYIAQPGDILVSCVFKPKIYLYKNGDPDAFVSPHLTIIRSLEDDYILSYLKTQEGKKEFKEQMEDSQSGTITPFLTTSAIKNISIPIIPVSELNSLGDESIKNSTEEQLKKTLEELEAYKKRVSKLEDESDDLTKMKIFIEDRFNKMMLQLNKMDAKLDYIVEYMKEISNDFKNIKSLPREEDEKVLKMCQSIDRKMNVFYEKEKKTIEDYVESIKLWLDFWDVLSLESKKFLPIAEFIFDQLFKIEEADYSPFVVQYCRSLENEILKKLFEAYHFEGLKNVGIEELISEDLQNEKTGRFAKMIKLNKTTYTMGDMHFTMSLLKEGGDTLKGSRLLQHFKEFVVKYFDNRILEKEFMKDLAKITNDFRNKAAHPYIIKLETANECKALLRKNLNVFLESRR